MTTEAYKMSIDQRHDPEDDSDYYECSGPRIFNYDYNIDNILELPLKTDITLGHDRFAHIFVTPVRTAAGLYGGFWSEPNTLPYGDFVDYYWIPIDKIGCFDRYH